MGVESVVFNHRTDDLHSDSLQSIHNGYCNNVASPTMLGATGPTILNKLPGIPCFLGTERKKDTVQFKQWYHAISDAQKNFNEQLVGATLDDILEKSKWLYGSVESSDTLMQEFYRIIQGKSEKVQTFVLHLERAPEAIKQQHPYAMTEEEGIMYGMTTLAPSINFTVDGFDFLLGFALLKELCWVVVVF